MKSGNNLSSTSPSTCSAARCSGSTVTRRRLLLSSGALSAATLFATSSHTTHAAPRVTVTPGGEQAVPIAISDFVPITPADGELARNTAQIITSNLKRSGQFAPIDPQAYIEK